MGSKFGPNQLDVFLEGAVMRGIRGRDAVAMVSTGEWLTEYNKWRAEDGRSPLFVQP